MKVGFISHSSRNYGASRSLSALIQGLRRHNVQSQVVLPRYGAFQQDLSRDNVPHRVLAVPAWLSGVSHSLERLVNLRQVFVAARHISAEFAKNSVDIIHSNSLVSPVGLLVARVLRVPHVWHAREFGHCDYEMQWDWGRFFSTQLFRQADANIAVSQAISRHHIGHYPRRNQVVVYNGVAHAAEFKHRRICQRPNNDSFTFLLMGRLLASKGHAQAIRALAMIRNSGSNSKLISGLNAKLKIVGEGDPEYEAQLRRAVTVQGVEGAVEFHGHLDNTEPAYLSCDALLLCSRREAMGRVTAEAMSYARPVIGLASGATPELVQHGCNGLLYDGSDEHLAECMRTLITKRISAQAMGHRAWESARTRFSIENYANQVHDIYSELLR